MKLAKISKQVIFLGVVSFFTDFASEMLYPVTPIFLSAALGASMATVGLIEGFAEVTAGLLKGYFGAVSDKIGKRSIFVVIGYGLSAVVKSLPGFFPFVPTVIFSRISDRIGKGIRTAPRDALLAAYSKGNTGAVFGFHRSMDTLGAVVGPLVAILLLFIYPGNYTLIFLMAFIPSIFAIFFTLKVKDPPSTRPITKKKYYKEFWQTAPRDYKIVLVLITLFSLVNSSDVFLILKSRDIAKSDTIAILGYVFYNFVYALSSYPAGIIADKLGKKNVFMVGLLIFSLVYLGFGFNNNLTIIWPLFAIYGVYTASTEGVTKAWIADLIEDKYRGSGIGLLTSLSSLAIMLGSVFTGILWDQFGPKVPFLISSGVSIVVAAILFFFKETKTQKVG